MNLLELLQQFKHIEADKNFTAQSRRLILASRKAALSPRDFMSRKTVPATVWQIIRTNLELGATVALAGLLIVMILGGFSAWKIFSPLQIANFDSAGIRAEAEAIDIQIQLTNLNYQDNSTTSGPPTTSESTANPVLQRILNTRSAPATETETSRSEPSVAQPSQISIDEALEKLAE